MKKERRKERETLPSDDFDFIYIVALMAIAHTDNTIYTILMKERRGTHTMRRENMKESVCGSELRRFFLLVASNELFKG
ncbi:hypothetical protein TSAR_002250 [Trichomalopsis sarcophagae]|uniref:Uncharacterized protein n=1 Tax=Trichomalopsis sarcophagae TaxID=543379 RepID=A0A232EYW7_9HYME|nr:hypothetical protein TSAR_002250 [Trichomalopsis sarcophagae]